MKNLAFLRGKTILRYTSKITYNIQDVLGVTWGLTQVVEEEDSAIKIASLLKTK